MMKSSGPDGKYAGWQAGASVYWESNIGYRMLHAHLSELLVRLRSGVHIRYCPHSSVPQRFPSAPT